MYQADSGEWQTVTVQFSSLSSSRAIQLSFSPYLVSQGGIGICVLAHPLNCQKFDFLKCESISILPHKKTGTVTWSEDGQNLLPMHIKKPKKLHCTYQTISRRQAWAWGNWDGRNELPRNWISHNTKGNFLWLLLAALRRQNLVQPIN